MAWIFFRELVGLDLPLNHGCEQLPIVSVTNTHKVCFCPVCDQVRLIEHQSGTMLQHSEAICCQGLTSSREDSHAKTLVLQELEKAWQESEVVFSSRSSGLPESANLDLFSWKTSLPSEPVEGREWLKNWPRSGMTVAGQLYQPPQLEPPTREKDGFCWPTPTVCGNYQHKGNMIGLATAVRMWPTPRASEYKDCGPVGSKSQIHMDKRDYLCAKAKDASNPTGQLSPMWVEWLMGYRIGHTELDALAIQWFRSKFGKRLKN